MSCGCECTRGGFCGGCGHAGCGKRGRQSRKVETVASTLLNEPGGYRVVRIERVAVDDTVYTSATAATAARDELWAAHPGTEYAVVHTSYPVAPRR